MGEWPPQIEVGDRVHWGVSSPDTGIVLSITKNRRWARVKWDKNGTRREEMTNLFSVTRSLTEWACFKRGVAPCSSCGYESKDGVFCHLCVPKRKDASDRGAAGNSARHRERRRVMREKLRDWDADCLHWRDRVLTGEYRHWCFAWDFLPVDETCPEWPCECAEQLRKDATDGE